MGSERVNKRGFQDCFIFYYFLRNNWHFLRILLRKVQFLIGINFVSKLIVFLKIFIF